VKIVGRYEIERELGRGGMSVVHLAYDTKLHRKVAIKVLHPHLASREEARKRFLQEAKAIARLKHPNILEVYDYDASDAQTSYIVSEYIDGMTLRQYLEHQKIEHAEIVALIACPLFEALAHAHENQIIHRDIKPENLMIRSNGSPVLMDFGIAHLVDAETLTATGAVIGSPAHMAPEVVNGETLSFKSDLFSMGTVLYWMICGVLPFVANHPAALFRKILECNYEPISFIKPQTLKSLSRLVERCLKRDPAERPDSAAKIAIELKSLLYELGLNDAPTELDSLYHHWHDYQKNLPQRIIPYYMSSAKMLIDQKSMAQGIDRLNRILSLDPQHEEAKSLLDELTNNQDHWKNGLLYLLLGLFSGLVVFWLLPTDQTQNAIESTTKPIESTTKPIESTTKPIESTTKPIESTTKAVERTTKAVDPIDQAIVDSQIVAMINTTDKFLAIQSKDQETQVLINERNLGSLTDFKKKYPQGYLLSEQKNMIRLISKKCGNSIHRLDSKQISQQKQPLITIQHKCKDVDSLNPTTPSLETSDLKNSNQKIKTQENIPPIHSNQKRIIKLKSRYKKAEVFINQKKYGQIVDLERNHPNGLELDDYQVYHILIKNERCQDLKETVNFKENRTGEPAIFYDCVYLPARLKISSPQNLDVYVNNVLVGKSNQELLLPVTEAKTMISVMTIEPKSNQIVEQIKMDIFPNQLTQRTSK
jgi:serine/threonine protein kinase